MRGTECCGALGPPRVEKKNQLRIFGPDDSVCKNFYPGNPRGKPVALDFEAQSLSACQKPTRYGSAQAFEKLGAMVLREFKLKSRATANKLGGKIS